ncbi:HlyD family type I secretion periplasmic adaptor subunit [Vibrio maerlii]|uniref:HlyD family type I secretion periplasmic adaptor subunit n=1 Tax=Vibrio maerlii TaxID=2231648 RepID=UPI000E3CC1F4|nr:HlyD family type I secretion periplasmic adaptor subunit [Vibrio maerlii]
MAREIIDPELLSKETIDRFEPSSPLRVSRYVIGGLFAFTLFVGGFGIWSVTAKLESAAIAYGEVVVGTQRQAVQHLEGGIVEKILVREGDSVQQGDLIARLSDSQPLAQLQSLRGQYIHARSKESRLTSELEQQESIRWHTDLEMFTESDTLLAAEQIQQKVFAARQAYFASQKAILTQLIEGSEVELVNVRKTINIEKERLYFINDEIKSNKALFKKGFSGKSALLSLQRVAAEVRSEISQLERQALTVEQQGSDAIAQLKELELERLKVIVEELRETQKELVLIHEEYQAAKDVYERTNIVAPISGKIVNMQVFSEHGVIQSGQVILEIVPDNEELIVESRVDPKDVDLVATGQSARVRLTALNSRTVEPMEGKVLTISADKLTTQDDQQYYLTRIELEPEALASYTVTPGMNAEVLILSEPRTPMDYLLKPITDSFERAFREE